MTDVLLMQAGVFVSPANEAFQAVMAEKDMAAFPVEVLTGGLSDGGADIFSEVLRMPRAVKP